jgi:hypothetical protein
MTFDTYVRRSEADGGWVLGGPNFIRQLKDRNATHGRRPLPLTLCQSSITGRIV